MKAVSPSSSPRTNPDARLHERPSPRGTLKMISTQLSQKLASKYENDRALADDGEIPVSE
eukprot:IDg6484t1